MRMVGQGEFEALSRVRERERERGVGGLIEGAVVRSLGG